MIAYILMLGSPIGLKNYFKIRTRFDLSVTTGLDYFGDKELKGHDTSYSPDGTSVNGRQNYTYKDADKAINQPKIELILMLGFHYHFN